jgi:hypothetical protein
MRALTTAALYSALPLIAAAPPAITLRFLGTPPGAFAVDIGGEPWLLGASPSLLSGGYLYSAASGSLTLASNTTSAGADALGAFTATTSAWTAVGGPASGATVETSIYIYHGGSAVQFATAFPSGAAAQAVGGANASATGGLASTFPSLALAPAAATLHLGSVFQAPKSGNCGWTVNALPTFPVPSGGLLLLEPLNASAARAAVGVAALADHASVRQAAVPAAGGDFALALGPGAEFDLPAGFVSRALLVAVAAASAPPPPPLADLGFPAGGPGAALRALGDALLAFHNKSRPAMNFDAIHAGLGVSTTTFYFYNPCDCGRWANNTCPPDDGSNPGRLHDCTTYADTLERVVADWRARRLPFSHLLIDSFWYGEGVYDGVSEWADSPDLMAAVHSFPRSLRAFSDAIGRDVALWAHNGHFIAASPYRARYPFRELMPQGPDMWRALFSANAAAWNLRMIKQDHVGETIASVGPISDPALIPSWWGGMGVGAAENGVSIQFCCSPPLVLLGSLAVPAARGARSSPDYVLVGEHDATPRTLFQWANGAEAAFHYAIGLMPDKDGFFSNSTEMQQAWKHVPSANAPPFFNFTEANPLQHALSALLCGGPVHVGDAVGATNETLVRALMRADGLMLRASRPHAAVDAQWRSMAAGAWAAGGAGAASLPAPRARGSPPPPPAGRPDESLANSGLGEVYSTVSLINPGAGAGCARFTIVTAAGVSQPLALAAADVALDAASLAGAECTAGAGAWAAYEWDLRAFAPSAAPGGAVRRVFTGAGGAADVLPIAAAAAPRYADAPLMLVVAPVVGEWVLLGEVGKVNPVSPQRLAAMGLAPGGGVAVSLIGAPGEAVTVAACRLDAATGACAGGAAPARFTCELSADTPIGVATLTLDEGGNGACS